MTETIVTKYVNAETEVVALFEVSNWNDSYDDEFGTVKFDDYYEPHLVKYTVIRNDEDEDIESILLKLENQAIEKYKNKEI